MHLIRWPDRLLVYNPASGRHLVLPPDAEPTPELLARRLAPGPYPVRSRLVLLLPESGCLWYPLPHRRTAGGHAYAELPLSPEEMDLWRACDGQTQVDLPTRLLRRLLDPQVQALQLRERQTRRNPAMERLAAVPRPPHPDRQGMWQKGATSLRDYHLQIDADRHFDQSETTIAHALALPHPALGGQRFGERLRQILGGDGRILEIGAGTGELAQAFGPADYTRLDLSPALLAAQGERAPWSSGVHGDATELPFADASFDTVICNEVIADLRAAPTAEGWTIHPEPGQALFNTGAFACVREIARVLRPGGRAWVSEFGGEAELPTETVQLDHPEVSIHFGQVAEIARQAGLQARIRPMGEALGIDPAALWPARPCFEALRARWPWIESRAVLPDLPERVEGLWEVTLAEPGPGPAISRFCALELAKQRI